MCVCVSKIFLQYTWNVDGEFLIYLLWILNSSFKIQTSAFVLVCKFLLDYFNSIIFFSSRISVWQLLTCRNYFSLYLNLVFYFLGITLSISLAVSSSSCIQCLPGAKRLIFFFITSIHPHCSEFREIPHISLHTETGGCRKANPPRAVTGDRQSLENVLGEIENQLQEQHNEGELKNECQALSDLWQVGHKWSH